MCAKPASPLGEKHIFENQSVKDGIPNGVKRIGRYAFASNNLLTEVELPEGMEEIGDYAFYECSELTNVVVHGGLKRIGEAAFLKCGKLQRPSLPSSVEIGDWAFGQAPDEKRE